MSTPKRAPHVRARDEHTSQTDPLPETEEEAAVLPSAASPGAPGPQEPVPTFAQEERPQDPAVDPGAEPLPKEYVGLAGNASYGPVIMGGRRVTAKKDTLYHVPDIGERTDILGTGRFRAGTRADLARTRTPSAGSGGALTRDLLPPGALKGGH